MPADRDAFGYRAVDGVTPVVGAQVAEGKDPDTLEPRVMMFLREDVDSEQEAYALPIELAEVLAGELMRWAARAREKHFE